MCYDVRKSNWGDSVSDVLRAEDIEETRNIEHPDGTTELMFELEKGGLGAEVTYWFAMKAASGGVC